MVPNLNLLENLTIVFEPNQKMNSLPTVHSVDDDEAIPSLLSVLQAVGVFLLACMKAAMSYIRNISLLIAGVFLLSAPLWAKETKVVHQPLTDVMQKALLNSPEVLSKWHAFTAAEEEVDVGRGALRPKIDITAGVGREVLRQPGAATLNYDRTGMTATLNQMLYDGFTASSEVKRLGKSKLARYFELLDAAENTALEAARAYYDVMRFRFLFKLAEQNYIEHRTVYEQLLQRAQTGAGRRVDVEHAESRLALADYNLTTEQANLHDVMARYMRIVNEAPPLVMFGPMALGKNFPGKAEDALKLAFQHNPTLRTAVENIEAAQYDLAATRGAMHPRVDLRVRSELTDNYQGTPGTRGQQVAELVLNYNLFNGGSDAARIRQLTERRNLAIDLRNKACRDIRQTLVIAHNDVHRLRSQLSFIGIQVSSIEKTRDAYIAQFNIGQRSLLDVLDTENELLSARRTEINAEIDLSMSLLRTFAGMGRLLTEFGLKHTERGDLPGEDEFTAVPLAEICEAQAPNALGIDNVALTARALRQLDRSKPATAAAAPVVPVAAPGPSDSAVRSAPTSDATKAAPGEEALGERLKAWLAAWSARDVDAYMSFYGTGFVPANGLSRDVWRQQRQARLTQPSKIQVDAADLQIEVNGEQGSTAFLQHYASNIFTESAPKTIDWKLENGQWMIQREYSKSAPRRDKSVSPAPTSDATGAATSDSVRNVVKRLTGWLAAWSARDVEDYLSFYGTDFVPEKGLSRDLWRQQRQVRLTRPSKIQVDAADPEIKVNGEQARSVFMQHYASDIFIDAAPKTIDWVLENGQWMIKRERSMPAQRGVKSNGGKS
jgi:outer membrane protein, adhesin transport system